MEKKVLVVGNDPEMSIYIAALLETRGFVSLSAEDDIQALELARKEDPILVMLDIMMPKEKGFTTYRNLRNDPVLKNKPVILLSALPVKTFFRYWNSIYDYDRSEFARPADCVEMPPEPDELLEMINKHLA